MRHESILIVKLSELTRVLPTPQRHAALAPTTTAALARGRIERASAAGCAHNRLIAALLEIEPRKSAKTGTGETLPPWGWQRQHIDLAYFSRLNQQPFIWLIMGGGDEKMTIAISRIANETKNYKGFTISWREPDFAGAKWTANVTSEEAHRAALLRHGVQIIEGQNRDEMIAQSKEYIDSLFGYDPS